MTPRPDRPTAEGWRAQINKRGGRSADYLALKSAISYRKGRSIIGNVLAPVDDWRAERAAVAMVD
jgi:hypothetical protein